MKKQNFKSTILSSGVKATVLVADLQQDQQVSVISNSLLKRMVELLPQASMEAITQRLVEKINEAQDVSHLCEVLVEELDFHKSVNLINSFFMEEDEVSPVAYTIES